MNIATNGRKHKSIGLKTLKTLLMIIIILSVIDSFLTSSSRKLK
jgi:hypothetical protein